MTKSAIDEVIAMLESEYSIAHAQLKDGQKKLIFIYAESILGLILNQAKEIKAKHGGAKMNDKRIPQGWSITKADYSAHYAYDFQHENYDGLPDGNNHLGGYGYSVEDCLEQIAEFEACGIK